MVVRASVQREELAHTFGVFKTESVLGRGQFGTVYYARHINDGSIVALKVLDPELCSDAVVRRRFVRRDTRRVGSTIPTLCPALQPPIRTHRDYGLPLS